MTNPEKMVLRETERAFVYFSLHGLGLTILLASSPSALGQSSSITNDAWAFVGGTVYVSRTEAPVLNGVVLIKGGKIAAVGPRGPVTLPPGVKALDCSGLTITAGFWNSHAHFIQRKWAKVSTIPAPELTRQLQDMLTRYGFTSVFDTGSKWENTRRLHERLSLVKLPARESKRLARSSTEALIASV